MSVGLRAGWVSKVGGFKLGHVENKTIATSEEDKLGWIDDDY